MDKTQIQVLLIEDNPTDVIFLREALGQDALNSFDLTTVERLHSAIEILQKNTFDVILLDLGLPDIQGLETFTRIHQRVPEIPKVILSGLTDEALALQAVQAGAQDYIVKGTAGFASAARAIRYGIERQQAQTALRASEERFRALIENGLDDISLLDAEGNLLWESPAVVRNLGYVENENVGRNIFELVHPDDQAWTGDLHAKLLQEPGSRQAGNLRLRHANGSWRWVEAIVINMLNNPTVNAIVVNYRDITERKQAEDMIRGLARFPEENPNPTLRVGADGQIIYANSASRYWLESWKLSVGDHLPADWKVLVAEAYKRDTKQTLDISIQDRIYEILIVSFREEGYINIYGRDITERKQIESSLHASEARYRLATLATRDVIWEWRPDTGHLTWAENAQNVFGYPPEEVGPSDKWWDDHIHPEDRERVISKLTTVVDGSESIWLDEYRFLLKDGTYAYISDHGYIERDTSGKVIRIIGAMSNVTERKQADEKLRESEARFASIFHTNPTRVSITSFEEGRFLDVNESFLESSGYKRQEVIGHTSLELNDWVDPQDRIRLRAVLEEQGNVQNFETRLRQKSGDILDILISAELVDLFGQRCILSVGLDITDRKQAEEELRENAADQALINRLNEAANRGESLDALIKMLDKEFQEHFSTKGLCLCLLSEDRKTLNMLGFSITEEILKNLEELIGRHIPPIRIPLYSGGIFEKLLQAAEGTIIIDPQGIRQWMAEFEEAETTPDNLVSDVQKLIPQIYILLGIESIVSLPLISGEHTIGLLNITSTNLLTNNQMERFQKIGSQLTAAILRKQDEQKLLESNERFRQLSDNIQEVFWITDAISGEEIYFSPAAEKIWGRSLEYLMQTPNAFIECVLPEDRLAVLRALEKQKNGEGTEIEYRTVHPDGSVHWIWDRAFPIFDDSGKVVRLAGIAADMTERKEAEEALRESEERFRSLFDRMLDGVYRSSHAGRFVDVNPAMVRMFGYSSREEMLNVDIKNELYFAPDERGSHILDTGREETDIYRMRRKDGSEIWVEDHGSYVHDKDGNILYHEGILREITERKLAEKEITRHLAEFEALYENGLAVSRLLETHEIGERIINTFERYLSWHHVTIRLLKPATNELEIIAFNVPNLKDEEARKQAEQNFNKHVQNVGQGLSGWVVQTGQPFRTGNVHEQAHYVNTYPDIQSGLYMPLKVGNLSIGVISVESEEPNAFTEQDERLLATLANQAAIAFENARLYQAAQQELQERERAETALRTSETHYRELADSITDIFFELDQNLHYSHWNKASELLTGVPQEQAIGKSMREIFGKSEEQDRIEKIYKDVLINQRPRTFETLFRVNNQQGHFEVNAYPSSRGVAVVAKDVTERKRTETIMQKRFELMEFAARHTLEEIMQMTTDEVSTLTGSTFGFFHIMEADQATPGLQIWSTNTLSFFNVPVSEGQHRSVDQAGVWAEAVRQRCAVIHNDYESLPNKKALPPGHAPLIREMVIPIIRNEKILAVMGIANKPEEYTQQDLEIAERFIDYAWDITERKQMELALADERNQLSLRVEERTADLSHANADLARALRVKDEFLANMSHELRTPLNAILGLSESLAEQTAGPLNEKQQRYITTVSESGHHLLSLINDILDLAKIEAGQITLDVNKVDINSVCQASLRMIKQLARKKNQETMVEIDGRVNVMWADERRLKQMLVNLLSNAVKFTPEGGKLGLKVDGDQDANKVTFTIWDTGIGIKETDLPRLFQPFVQLDAGLAREASGTGLGLALVAQMARLHGGSASVTSQPGQGSRFSIMLPWEPALAIDTVERLKITGKFRPIKFNQGQKPTILLVEDTQEVIMMVSDYLELNGFKIVTAHDGVEGVIQAQLCHPDLILMDIQMPRMDGFEATKKLRSEPKFEHTPIIALTALAMPNDRERCLAAGMDEYITKPVHLRALVKIIGNFLSGEKEIKPQ